MKPQTTSKTLKATGLAVSAAALLGAVGYGLQGAHSGQADTAKPTAAKPTAAQPATSDAAAPYHPSQFPGVEVRSIPAAKPTAAAGGHWIYVKPGAKLPVSRVGTRSGNRRGVWYEAGRSPAGGVAAHVGPDFYPYAVARVGKDGKVHLDCVEGADHSRRQPLTNGKKSNRSKK